MAGGYNHKLLRVNLSIGNISSEESSELFCRRYLGGAGFIAYYLLKEAAPGVDPLGPGNKLIFSLGPVTGVALPGSGRNCIGAKSPLTGGFIKAEVGGFWGSELKRAGYDVIIVEGKAEHPVYLSIQDGKPAIHNASHLWGKTPKEAQSSIRAELGDEHVKVATIGLAGENQVRYACIANDLRNFAGRGGLGAVMGSKNLKAIAVRGSQMPEIADPEKLKVYRTWLHDNIKLMDAFREFGTGAVMERYEASGNLPIRNFRDGVFPEVKNISAVTIKNTIRTGMEGCFACPVRCKKIVEFSEPYRVDPDYGGPEYETLAALGSNCGVGDLKAVAKANELCSIYTIDSISAGVAIAFAMECFEKGLLTTKDTDGIELKFGNADAMLRMVELIARREGIGRLLAEGAASMAVKLGGGSAAFAIQSKGLEAGMHEPRLKAGLGLGFAVHPSGADHCGAIHDDLFAKDGYELGKMKPLGILEPMSAQDLGPRKVALFRYVQQGKVIADSMVLCMFFPYDYEQIAGIIAAVTGWNTGVVETMTIAHRTFTLARIFNVREGFTSADDRLPERFFHPKANGVLSSTALDPKELEKAKHYYYNQMGWDKETGVPLKETLEELDIAWAIPELDRH